MKIEKILILFLLIVISIVVGLCYYMVSRVEADVENRYVPGFDSVNRLNDSLRIDNARLLAGYDSAQQRINVYQFKDSMQQLILAKNEATLKVVRAKYRELQKINSYTPAEIMDYFNNNFLDSLQ